MNDIFAKIQSRLKDVEKEHAIEILLAVESGSRAWGFESVDSDYDVRFIYRHAQDWYLQVFPGRDVIEYPIIDDFDYSGWDIKKTLSLMYKSNPTLLEWLSSPIVYMSNSQAFELLKITAKDYFSEKRCMFHYFKMAEGNFKNYLKNDIVRTKKYFYVLRPLLACMWIEVYHENPPMEFEKMLVTLEIGEDVLSCTRDLLVTKKSGVEMGMGPKLDLLNDFIEKRLEEFEIKTNRLKIENLMNTTILDRAFRELICT